jgi:hypothetical protein
LSREEITDRAGEALVRRAILLAVFLTLASVADATSLKDFWSTRPADDPHFQSSKSSLALEECIALALSEKIGVPNIIHGERETIITGMSGGIADQPMGGARIVDSGVSREVFVGAVHTGGLRDKLSALVRRCI